MLILDKITKSFSKNTVLRDVGFDVRAGEIHALVGENGAGKSTLMKIISGLEHADSGHVHVDGEKMHHTTPHAAILSGINLIHQELNIAQNITVAENIFLGFEKRIGGFLKNTRAMNAEAQTCLNALGADFQATDIAGTLTMGQQQQIEIAKALVHKGKIIILDEPTSSLSEKESHKLFEILKSLRKKNVAIIYISHRMNEIYELADRVTVLRDGNYIGTLEKEEITNDAVITMMVGRPLENFYTKDAVHTETSQSFEVRNVSGSGMQNLNFSARCGEVLGFAGLIGAGRTEFIRLICGIDPMESGEILLNGEPLHITSPIDAMKHGIVYLPEDRKKQGLFLDMSCGMNIAINKISDTASCGVLKKKEIDALVQKNIEAYQIKLAHPTALASSLSGGNQQKLLIARLVSISPRVIFLDEPTRGVDVATKMEIYKLMHQMSRQGAIVIFISSDLPEVIGVAHRVIVMHEGAITGELSGDEISQERIMKHATGLERVANLQNEDTR